ncbi:ABC transporter permease subunit [Bradyrhizobium sp. 179]|uniref:ABC transporter permease n=1 Tax=Bradyrhizobium sp. 179 TaxID=2782648 RepID=UPI001FFA1A08|nr:ABC transporter permease subunit [Bradyrhizobium sp. 179]MCK1544305.1 ABC transporter permease subunit [Bradyrhizobium sp. 179]
MSAARSRILLLLPAVAVFALFLAIPMLTVLDESFRTFEPGPIGSVQGAPLTVENYAELLRPVYVQYFAQTYFPSFCASALAVTFAFPIAYYIARNASPWVRRASLAVIIGRVYSLQLTFGSTGILAPVMSALGLDVNGRLYIDVVIVAGLLHYTIPMSILILIGAIQNLNPRLPEAAQSLGVSAFKSHLTVTIPLCIRGLVSAFLVSMTFGVSAFVIPWILGRGRVLFISNLIYSRFSEIANYPSGAAISIVMMVLSILLIYVMSKLTTLLDRT